MSEREPCRWSLALQSVTPGGSEYADDPERCVAFVRESRQGQHRVIMRFKKERDAALARVRELEAALDRYGEHNLRCATNSRYSREDCTCGLDAAIRGEGA